MFLVLSIVFMEQCIHIQLITLISLGYISYTSYIIIQTMYMYMYFWSFSKKCYHYSETSGAHTALCKCTCTRKCTHYQQDQILHMYMYM